MRLTYACFLNRVILALSWVLVGCKDSPITDFSECGNGVLEFAESCDDGNTVPGDGCEPDCTSTPVCPNGVVEAGEDCDDGNTVPGDGCEPDCTWQVVAVRATCVAAIPAFRPDGAPARGEDGEPIVLETAISSPDSGGACTLYVSCGTIPGGRAVDPVLAVVVRPLDAIALSDDRVRIRVGQAQLLLPSEAAPSALAGSEVPLNGSLEYRLEAGDESVPLLSERTDLLFTIPRENGPPAPIYLGSTFVDREFQLRFDLVPVLVSVSIALDIDGAFAGFDCERIGDSRVELSLVPAE